MENFSTESTKKDWISGIIMFVYLLINVTDACFATVNEKLERVHFFFAPFLDTAVLVFWVAVIYHFGNEVITGFQILKEKYGIKFYEKNNSQDVHQENNTN
jgi:hypothetical protein